jgi:solute carrier family 25 folate transporter 32
MVAGAGAGLVSSIVTCPLDVVKTRLQAQHLARDAVGYEGVNGTIKRIYKTAGLKGFYRGLGPTLAGYLPTWGIYFTVYDMVKDRLGGMADHSCEYFYGARLCEMRNVNSQRTPLQMLHLCI